MEVFERIKEIRKAYFNDSNLEYCIGQSMKANRPIFNYVKIMRKHADEAIRKILDNLK